MYKQGNDGLMAENTYSPFPGALIVLNGKLKHHFYIKTNVGILLSGIPNSGWEGFSCLRWGNLATLPEHLAGTHLHFSTHGGS